MVLLPLLLLFTLSVNSQNPLQVETASGPVVGYELDGVKIWSGIPFAAPPVGNNRFKPPQPVQSWTEPKFCYAQSNSCAQLDVGGVDVLGEEDCLYLDVYVPQNATSTSKLPVLIWIYGGAWVFGDKYEFGFYDATNKVKFGNYIHVAGNYRLGPFGFYALPELFNETSQKTTGNYALQDQVAVMQWVQKNIAAFGGDPTKVTINGESAGAFSVCWHLVNQASKGLFQAAIMESGQCDIPNWWVPYNDAIEWGVAYGKLVGCNDRNNLLPCLRQLTAAQVMGASWEAPAPPNAPLLYPIMDWAATIDNSYYGLTGLPLDLIKKGQFNKVTLIVGTNYNEGDIFVPATPMIVPGAYLPFDQYRMELALSHYLNTKNQTLINVILDLYDSESSYESMLSQIICDSQFVCPTRRLVREFYNQGVPAYLYEFTYDPGWVDVGILGDYHSVELDFVFSNAWPPIIHSFTETDQKMSNFMMTYWRNVVYNANPNEGGVPINWPTYDTTNKPILRFDWPALVNYDYAGQICDFWDNVNLAELY